MYMNIHIHIIYLYMHYIFTLFTYYLFHYFMVDGLSSPCITFGHKHAMLDNGVLLANKSVFLKMCSECSVCTSSWSGPKPVASFQRSFIVIFFYLQRTLG